MTDLSALSPGRLWAPSGFRDNDWRYADSAEASGGKVILTLNAALAAVAGDAPAGGLGVAVQPGEPIDPLLKHLDRFALVALAFPAFNDGRSFSKAELLRRHGFAGTIRATGQVLVDQLPLMLRVGFDEFEISNPVLLDRLERGEVGGIPLTYQPTAVASDLPAAVLGAPYAWRRVRAG